MTYTTVLIAVDLGDSSPRVFAKAKQLAHSPGAELHVLHAVEPLGITYGGDIPMDFSSIQDEIYQQATEQLNTFCEQKGVAPERRHLVIGRPESEIPTAARNLNADVIVMGSHSRYGLAILLGSTTDGVVHSAPCDVLAVHVEGSE